MSMCHCLIHDKLWDSDKAEECPKCSVNIAGLEENMDELKRFLKGMKQMHVLEHFPTTERLLLDKVLNIKEEIMDIHNRMFGYDPSAKTKRKPKSKSIPENILSIIQQKETNDKKISNRNRLPLDTEDSRKVAGNGEKTT